MATTRAQRAAQGARLHQGIAEIQRVRAFRRLRKRYKPTDTSHRHRLKDAQRKTITVTSHTRRI